MRVPELQRVLRILKRLLVLHLQFHTGAVLRLLGWQQLLHHLYVRLPLHGARAPGAGASELAMVEKFRAFATPLAVCVPLAALLAAPVAIGAVGIHRTVYLSGMGLAIIGGLTKLGSP